jgi:hypothetical protein
MRKPIVFSLLRVLFSLSPLVVTVAGWAASPRSPQLQFEADFSGGYFDSFWCRGSMIPIQDPVFPTIRRDAFKTDTETDIVQIPGSWIKEARETRWPQLMESARKRLPILLTQVERVVGRPFIQRDFSFFFYFCPAFNGGTAIPAVYPIFPYLKAAVGDLSFPDWIFTDQYTFHEVLHLYVKERIDYSKGSPVLNTLYGVILADQVFESKAKSYLNYPNPITPEYASRWETTDRAVMAGTALTHIHVYGIMTQVLRAIGEDARLNIIRSFEMDTAASHPSYVWAWNYIKSIEGSASYMRALLDEVQ